MECSPSSPALNGIPTTFPPTLGEDGGIKSITPASRDMKAHSAPSPTSEALCKMIYRAGLLSLPTLPFLIRHVLIKEEV